MEAVMKEFSVHSWRLECTLSVSTIIEEKERLFFVCNHVTKNYYVICRRHVGG